MSMRDCIGRAVEGGEMDPGRAAEALDLFDDLERGFSRRMGADEAARRAGAEAFRILRTNAVEKRRRDLLTVRAQQRIARDMETYRNARGEADMAGALMAHLDRDELARFSSVVAREDAVWGRLHGRMTEVLYTFRKDLLGRTREPARLKNLVREVFGEATGDANARELAAAFGETAEFARLKYNAAGGHIPKRADWGMPQVHDSLKVRQAPFQEWRDFILPKLDLDRMIDERTGLPFTPEALELVLKDVHERIRTDGWSAQVPSAGGGGRALANRRADHRFMAFRSADDWLAYQERFGEADPFSAMISHLKGMARDIALMEVLGPNPSATLRFMEATALKRAAELDAESGGTAASSRARSAARSARTMYDFQTGTANAPINNTAARTFAGLRSFLQSAQLGSAAISALTDVNFQRLAAAHAGLPQLKVMERLLKLLNPANEADRMTAVRLGLIAENWSSMAIAQQRFVGEVTGPEVSRRLADAVMRLSGLSPWTQAGRWAFGMEFLGHLADQSGRTFDALDAPFRKTLSKYGIGAGDWDTVRATPMLEEGGARFLRPEDIALRTDLPPGRADDLATRVLEMVRGETEFAVPSSSLRGRVMLIGNNRPGTLIGEILRSGAMYKNFAVTIAFTHIRRAVMQQGAMGKGAYAMNLTISTALMGALALQLKEISKGRDPRPMDTPEFMGAALLQGGGLGIFGDLLFSDVNRFGGGLAHTVAGPVLAFGDDVRRLTVGNLLQMPGEDETNFGRELPRFLKRYTPGGSIWYARLGYERLMLDRLQLWTDPDARAAFRRQEQRIRREYDQRYWWRPGRAAPRRAPDIGNAAGDLGG